MNSPLRLPEVRLVDASLTGHLLLRDWCGAPSNTLDAPKGRPRASYPQVVVFAEIKPRLTEANLMERYAETAAVSRPTRGPRMAAVEVPTVAANRVLAALPARCVRWLGLVAALAALAVATPVA